MRYDGISVIGRRLKGNFDFGLSSRSRLDYGYFVRATKGVLRIWNVDPLKSTSLLVLRPHGINLSPTLADARVGVAWRVASVRCQVAVRSGEWQVSGVRWRCAVQAYV